MMYIDDATIDRWIQEDAPYLDLTTHLLGIGSRPGRLTLRARTDMVVCGTDEARRVLGKLGVTVEYAWPNGRPSPAGQVLIVASGPAGAFTSPGSSVSTSSNMPRASPRAPASW